MAKIQRGGNIQLKVVDIECWNDKSGANIGLKFHFVDAKGDTTEGVQSYTRKDGSANPNIEAFIAANETGKSILCEMEEKDYNGNPQYQVKWPVRERAEGVKVNAAKAREMVKAALAAKPADPEKGGNPYPDDSGIPF